MDLSESSLKNFRIQFFKEQPTGEESAYHYLRCLHVIKSNSSLAFRLVRGKEDPRWWGGWKIERVWVGGGIPKRVFRYLGVLDTFAFSIRLLDQERKKKKKKGIYTGACRRYYKKNKKNNIYNIWYISFFKTTRVFCHYLLWRFTLLFILPSRHAIIDDRVSDWNSTSPTNRIIKLNYFLYSPIACYFTFGSIELTLFFFGKKHPDAVVKILPEKMGKKNTRTHGNRVKICSPPPRKKNNNKLKTTKNRSNVSPTSNIERVTRVDELITKIK